MAKLINLGLLAVAIAAGGFAAVAQAEIVLFNDNFNTTTIPDAGNGWGLNTDLYSRQSGTLGQIGWAVDKRSQSVQPTQGRARVNDATYGPNKLILLKNTSTPENIGAIIQHDFASGSQVTTAGGFNIRFDVDPISQSNSTGPIYYGTTVFIGAKDGSESNLSDVVGSTQWSGQNDPCVDFAAVIMDDGRIHVYHKSVLGPSYQQSIWFDQQTPGNGNWVKKTYTFELRTTLNANSFAEGTGASAELWWKVAGADDSTFAAIDLNGSTTGVADTWAWDADGTCFVGFAQRGPSGTSVYSVAQVDNVSLSIPGEIPEPSTLVLLCGGLIGLLAYAWRKRK